MEEREKIIKEIGKERENLLKIQEQMDFRDGGVFIRLFFESLIIDALVLLILSFTRLEDYKKIGILLVGFLLIFIILGMIYKKKLMEKKDRLIKERIACQKRIVSLSKKLN